jgi:NhaP-type Na+/H+ or K+/H+ antiporter
VSTPSLPAIAAILLLGIAAQLLARRLQILSVLFLIFVGVLLGDEGLGIVTLETFGDGLSTVVGLSIAIIVFEGLKYDQEGAESMLERYDLVPDPEDADQARLTAFV